MNKPQDRLNPKCPNPWLIFEQWGGTSWFTNKLTAEKQEHGNTETAKKYAKLEPSND